MPKDGQTSNPFWNLEFAPSAAERAQLAKTFKGHQNSVSGLAFHPKRMKSYTQTEQGDLAPDRALAMEGEITRGHDERARTLAIDSEITATVDPGAGKDTAGGAVARARRLLAAGDLARARRGRAAAAARRARLRVPRARRRRRARRVAPPAAEHAAAIFTSAVGSSDKILIGQCSHSHTLSRYSSVNSRDTPRLTRGSEGRPCRASAIWWRAWRRPGWGWRRSRASR